MSRVLVRKAKIHSEKWSRSREWWDWVLKYTTTKMKKLSKTEVVEVILELVTYSQK